MDTNKFKMFGANYTNFRELNLIKRSPEFALIREIRVSSLNLCSSVPICG